MHRTTDCLSVLRDVNRREHRTHEAFKHANTTFGARLLTDSHSHSHKKHSCAPPISPSCRPSEAPIDLPPPPPNKSHAVDVAKAASSSLPSPPETSDNQLPLTPRMLAPPSERRIPTPCAFRPPPLPPFSWSRVSRRLAAGFFSLVLVSLILGRSSSSSPFVFPSLSRRRRSSRANFFSAARLIPSCSLPPAVPAALDWCPLRLSLPLDPDEALFDLSPPLLAPLSAAGGRLRPFHAFSSSDTNLSVL